MCAGVCEGGGCVRWKGVCVWNEGKAGREGKGRECGPAGGDTAGSSVVVGEVVVVVVGAGGGM